MLPLRDSHPTNIVPFVTYILIAANVVIFMLELLAPDPEAFINAYALIPADINLSVPLTLLPFITSQFLHVGFGHIISNMWFLKIFGDNVEEGFGKWMYPVVYIVSGIAGGLAQYIFAPDSDIPMLGASGAVAGILGAYLVYFPKHRIKTLIPFIGFIRVVEVPASLMLIYWLVTQIFSGVGSVALAQTGGVAWFAHIGGFLTGWLIARFVNKKSDGLNFEGYEYIN